MSSTYDGSFPGKNFRKYSLIDVSEGPKTAIIYLFKVRNTISMCNLFKGTGTTSWHQWHRSGDFFFNFEQNSLCSGVSFVDLEHVNAGW